MILHLPEPASTIVATAAFTGLHRSELRGLQWSDYEGDQLRVTRSLCNGVVDEPKTQKSKAPVPVIRQLRVMLDAHRATNGGSGPIFENGKGRPLDLNIYLRQECGRGFPRDDEDARNRAVWLNVW